MTRFGFFAFHLLLMVVLYGTVYLNGNTPAAVSYTLREFTEPYFALVLLMTIVATIRWFMSHADEIAHEIVSWLNLLWVVPVFTLVSLWVMGAVPHNFWHGFHGLMTLR